MEEIINLENMEELKTSEETLDESESKMSFKLEKFEGPLDVLLHLIKEKNMSIMEVKLAEITDQYIKYIEEMDVLDMENASEFLEITSILLLIKSNSLLPQEETDDPDELTPEMELKLKLQYHEEYQLLRDAGLDLQKTENVDRFYKQPDKSVGDARIVFNQFNLDKLLDAFAFILMKTKDREGPQEKKINRDRWTVAEKIAFLTNILKDTEQINFFSLFDDSYSKLEVITVFMAILELLKAQKIEVVQADRYADITIKRREENNES